MRIRFAYWNAYWMNDLFVSGGALAFKPDDYVQPQRRGDTTIQRRRALAGVIDALEADAVALVEAPNRLVELQLFFDTDVTGDWACVLQPTKGSAQCIGLAVRTDTGKFAADPFEWFDLREETRPTPFHDAVQPFQFDSDDDEVSELYTFERLPLYAALRPAAGRPFRVLGLHLKSKGIFTSYEWSKWWAVADANRRKINAQANRLRLAGIDPYLTDPATAATPLLVFGDINDGPGMDASEKRLSQSGIETLMGDVWEPSLSLGNAIYEGVLTADQRRMRRFEEIATTSFRDPIFNQSYHRVWIDHLLYTRNVPHGWVSEGRVHETMPSGRKIWQEFPAASDHFPVSCIVETEDGVA